MSLTQYNIDAFTDTVFSGNQAAVCILHEWLDDAVMMSITKENNYSETAFAVKQPDGKYHLRWFTPGGEIDLCGHATLGTAYVVLNFYEKDADNVTFTTMSGELYVKRNGDLFEMDFPAYDLQEVPVTDAMTAALGVKPVAAFMARDLLCVLPKGTDIKAVQPDFDKVKELDGLLLNITVESDNDAYDTESRSFAPKLNVLEDPVCGSGHCHVVPYWTKVLDKDELVCYQASARGGVLYCKQIGDRIKMSGKVALYAKAELFV